MVLILFYVYTFRYTALDLALLGDYFDVARFIVDHGGVSGMHIESEAARKIQVL